MPDFYVFFYFSYLHVLAAHIHGAVRHMATAPQPPDGLNKYMKTAAISPQCGCTADTLDLYVVRVHRF